MTIVKSEDDTAAKPNNDKAHEVSQLDTFPHEKTLRAKFDIVKSKIANMDLLLAETETNPGPGPDNEEAIEKFLTSLEKFNSEYADAKFVFDRLFEV